MPHCDASSGGAEVILARQSLSGLPAAERMQAGMLSLSCGAPHRDGIGLRNTLQNITYHIDIN
jgi:hypothetical protein